MAGVNIEGGLVEGRAWVGGFLKVLVFLSIRMILSYTAGLVEENSTKTGKKERKIERKRERKK